MKIKKCHITIRSEMYHYFFLMEITDIKRKADKLSMHTLLLLSLCILCKSIVGEAMILNRLPSLQCFHEIIKFCFNR